MKQLFYFSSCFILSAIFVLSACNFNSNESPKTDKDLFLAKKPEVNLEGSVLVVDNGIMVLVQDGPLKKIPTILIAGTDSARTTLKKNYEERISEAYQTAGTPFVKLAGNFLREDSLRPIFKFTWVEFMDKASELKEIEEMEE